MNSSIPSRCRCIPVLGPLPDSYPERNMLATSQPIIQFKELTVDHVRYDAWKQSLNRPSRLPTPRNEPTVPPQR